MQHFHIFSINHFYITYLILLLDLWIDGSIILGVSAHFERKLCCYIAVILTLCTQLKSQNPLLQHRKLWNIETEKVMNIETKKSPNLHPNYPHQPYISMVSIIILRGKFTHVSLVITVQINAFRRNQRLWHLRAVIPQYVHGPFSITEPSNGTGSSDCTLSLSR